MRNLFYLGSLDFTFIFCRIVLLDMELLVDRLFLSAL